MIRGKKRQIRLTKEAILERVTEYDILRAFWPAGQKLELNKAIISPFRREENESFIVGTKYGRITYKDMGDYAYRGDVFDFVQQIERLYTLDEILRAIDFRLNLGFLDGSYVSKKSSPVVSWEQPKIELKPPPLIQVITRKFTKDELSWWNLYYQDIEDLKREYIYAPKTIIRNGIKIPLKKGDLVFCYFYPDIQKWKIYRPLAPKKIKGSPPSEWKWDSSVPFSHIADLKNIHHSYLGIIEKSKKDKMVLRKALEIDSICEVQAEDPSCLTDEAIRHIKNNSIVQIAVSDNDKKGKEFSWWLTNNHGFRHCNPPDPLREKGISDFADMAKEIDLLSVRKHFEKKGFLNQLLKTG